jgi:hypothetical protein
VKNNVFFASVILTDKCNKIEKLNFNAKAKIKEGIFKRGRYPKTASISLQHDTA